MNAYRFCLKTSALRFSKRIKSEDPVWVEVRSFDVLEVLVSADLELRTGTLVTDNDGLGVHLEGRAGPVLGDSTLDSRLEGTGLVVAVDQDDDLLAVSDCLDTDCQGRAWHCVDVTTEEAGVHDLRIIGQCLDPCA